MTHPTALVVLDLMTRIVALDLSPVPGTEVVSAAVRLTEKARAAGVPVIHVRVERPNVDEQPPGSGFVPESAPRDGEWEFVKGSVGVFETTDIDARLKEAGIEHLVLCGIATEMAILYSAREARDLGYTVTVAADAASGLSPQGHEAALAELAEFGEVTTVDALSF